MSSSNETVMKLETTMRPTLRQIATRFAAGSEGVATSLSLFMLMTMLLLGSIAVDYTNSVRTQAHLQAIADSAAMSGAMFLPDQALTRETAFAITTLNLAGHHRDSVLPDDVQLGRWNRITHRFEPGGTAPDAIRVTARRAESNGNALNTLLLRLVGIDQIDVSASAIGFRARLPRCSGGGYFSRERTEVVNSNHFRQGFCLHGEAGVTLRNVNTFDLGTGIGMRNLADFQQHTINYGVEEALRRNIHSFAFLDAMPDMIRAMRAGSIQDANLPDHITRVVTVNSISPNTTLSPGTLYIVNGNVNLGSNNSISDVAIVASGTIQANSNTRLNNVVLASEGSITLNSNNYLGGSAGNFCETGTYSTYILSLGNIVFNTNNTMRGLMMAANGTIDTGSNNDAQDGIYAEAGGRISLRNANSNSGCPEGLERQVGGEIPGETSPQLVL